MRRALALGVVSLALPACDPSLGPEPYEWRLPEHFEEPFVPSTNPMSAAKVELGRWLFYETLLSVSGEHSCASCHQQAHAFTDGLVTPVGADGSSGPRNAMSLVNVAYSSDLTWANPVLDTLEEQALAPLFLDHPLELGAQFVIADALDTLEHDEDYADRFAAAFPDEVEPVSVGNIAKAIAAFERTIIAADSPYDRYLAGDAEALEPDARRGLVLFESSRFGCARCHAGPMLAGGQGQFENVGLYNVGPTGAYPVPNSGLFEFTHDPADYGRYKVPSLRNVALTAPYMHDGSIETLGEVVDLFASGGRSRMTEHDDAPGRDNPNKSALVGGFEMTDQERADLVAFLESLSDESVVSDPRWSDPH